MTEPLALLLQVPTEPRFWIWQVESAQASSTAIHGWRKARLVVRTVRGSKMRRVTGVDDEFAAALQFPWYFGENWAAFDECITDLDWLPPEAGYVVVVTDPLQVLETSPSDFAVLVRSLSNAVSEWAAPVELGEWWDRPPVAFNIVLATDAAQFDDVLDRWTSAGATLSRLG